MDVTELIKALELELLQQEVRKSKERLNELIADNFLEIGSSGKSYNKQDIINELLKESETKITLKDFNTIEISLDTILATYLAEKEILGSNEKILSSRSSIWQNKNGNWQIIFHQGTNLNE
jgi:hypothetical protein